MNRLTLTPFFLAFFAGLTAMPTHVYQVCAWNAGTLKLEPWLTKTNGLLRSATQAIRSWITRLFSPRVAFACVVILLAVLVAHATADAHVTAGANEHVVLLGVAGTTISELFDKKKALVDEANAIRDRVYKDQNGEWRGDDTKRFDELMDQAEKITAEAQRLAKLDDMQKSIDDAGQSAGRRSAVVQPGREDRGRTAPPNGKPTVEDRSLALQGWVMGCSFDTEDLITERHRAAAQRCGVDLNRRGLRIRLSPVPLDGGVVDARGKISPDLLREWEKRLTQVDVVSPDLGGHYTVPDEMMRPLEVALLQFGGMRQVSEIIRTNTGADLPIPQLNDTSNKGGLLGEGLEHTEQDLLFTQLVLNSFKYTSYRVGMSVEYLQDNAINAAAKIGAILGERIGRITNEHFTRGDGSAKPKGVVTAATSSGITTAGATTITYDNIVDLKHSVDPAYRAQGGRFMFNDTTLKIVKKIKIAQFSGDTTGQPLWRAGFASGEPDTIDGDPYTINQDVESGTGKKAMLYGFFRKYLIREVRDITLVRLDERYAELGIVAFLAFSRHDGDLSDAGTHPVKYLTMG